MGTGRAGGRLRVGIIFGGKSGEHEYAISRRSTIAGTAGSTVARKSYPAGAI